MFTSFKYEIDNNIKEKIIKNIEPMCLELVPAFKVRSSTPENIFDNIVGKCAAYHLLKSNIYVKNLIYNDYWLNKEGFNKNLDNYLNLDSIHIEYWFKSGNWEVEKINFHKDKDEYNEIEKDNQINNQPLFTSLIYLSDNTVPTIIFDNEQKNLGISIPENDKTIVFNGAKDIHGHYPNFFTNEEGKRFLIAFNVFKHDVKFTDYFNTNQMYQWYYMKNKEDPELLPKDLVIDISSDIIQDIKVNIDNDMYDDFYNSLKNNNIRTNSCLTLKNKIIDEISLFNDETSRDGMELLGTVSSSYNIILNTDLLPWSLINENNDDDNDDDSDNKNYETNNNDEIEIIKKFNPYNPMYFNAFWKKIS